MKVHSITVTRAQYGFCAEVEIIVKTERAFSTEHHVVETGGHNIIELIWNIIFDSRKEAKRLKSLLSQNDLN